jgi:O-antigen/teichoic acid export membrane protein
MGAKVISVVCTLAQVPLALHALGAEAYGLWITLMSLTVMLNFIDLGLGVGMQKTMAVAFGQDNQVHIRRIFFTGALALAGFAVIALIIGLPLSLLLDWGGMLKINDPVLHGQAGIGLAITLAAFALGLPFNALPRLAAATQRGWLQAGWIAVGSIVSLGLVAFAAKARWGFLPFLAVTTLMPTLQGLGLWLHLRHALGWKKTKLELLSRAEWRALAGESLLFSVPQLGLALVQAAPPLVLSLAAGPVTATAFNLLQRLFSPVTQGQILALNPLWPAVTEAHVRGESAWVHRAFRQSLLVAGGCILALAALTQFSGPLLHAWIGEAAVLAPAPLAWLTFAWFVTQVAWQPLMYLLVGVSQLSALAVWGLVGPGLSLLGMIAALICHGGAITVLASAVIGLALGGLPGLAFATARALRGSRAPSP